MDIRHVILLGVIFLTVMKCFHISVTKNLASSAPLRCLSSIERIYGSDAKEYDLSSGGDVLVGVNDDKGRVTGQVFNVHKNQKLKFDKDSIFINREGEIYSKIRFIPDRQVQGNLKIDTCTLDVNSRKLVSQNHDGKLIYVTITSSLN